MAVVINEQKDLTLSDIPSVSSAMLSVVFCLEVLAFCTYPHNSVSLHCPTSYSVAKSVGCFQRRLFVCLFVNTITSERVNIE